MILIDRHPSADPATLQATVIDGLRENRLDPKGLYATPRQAELWRTVSRRHSPRYTRPEFRRIYTDAFGQAIRQMRDGPSIELVGFGGGTGEKEAQLCALLRAAGKEVHFTAIDVSEALVRDSAEALLAAGADPRRNLVCDLAEVKFISTWLERQIGRGPRLLTFFGLVPNFAPSQLGFILRGLIRPQDLLLASVHLVPGLDREEETGLHSGMLRVRPQYDNAETLAWLNAGLETWDLRPRLHAPEIAIGSMEGVPAFLGHAAWKQSGSIEILEEFFQTDSQVPLRLFQSLRYTPSSFDRLLKIETLIGKCLALTSCEEEGIWMVGG